LGRKSVSARTSHLVTGRRAGTQRAGYQRKEGPNSTGRVRNRAKLGFADRTLLFQPIEFSSSAFKFICIAVATPGGLRFSSMAICENRQSDFAVSNVVVDPLGGEIFARLVHLHRLDRSIFPQLVDKIIALCVCIRIRGVGDLK